jgi:hypothetical protein
MNLSGENILYDSNGFLRFADMYEHEHEYTILEDGSTTTALCFDGKEWMRPACLFNILT